VSQYTLVHGDALEAMRAMESGSVDAIVTDPPYCAGAISEAARTRASGQGLRSENLRRFGWFVGDNMGTAGLTWLLRAMAFEACRVVKPTGSMIVFSDWRMLSAIQPAVESAGVRYQNLIVWNKGSMGLGQGFRHQHEHAMHFTFGAPEYHDKGTSNVLDVGRVQAGDREHQTQKPVDLLRQMIAVVSPPDGVVLDPFMGSGSTGVAALLEGRTFVGVEREGEHVATARTRMEPIVTPTHGLPMFSEGAA
jgi:DNA modification methylase